ncbi:MAG TPA: AmmeMemoRadiSam system radical SAM enzyme [Chloroflexia bacterium]|nr:AmmeMemoRadiSam system radical SAM enzyme [Chloroflexia bacterium]
MGLLEVLSTATVDGAGSRNGKAMCLVCPHGCSLRTNQVGRCGVRVGTLAGEVVPHPAQLVAARGIGNVENHPLFHFYAGMMTLGVGAIGCSAACRYCQNWELALAHKVNRSWNASPVATSADDLIAVAQRRGCGAIAFTYNEPTVWPEAIVEIAGLARESGLRVIIATNGFVTERTLEVIAPYLDAVKLDLKAHNEIFYRRIAGISLQGVLRTLEYLRAHNIWHEVSTVIVPGGNDSPQAVRLMARHILAQSGPETPWHLMRFFPAYEMVEAQSGTLETLRAARSMAMEEGIRHVYISNIPALPERNTYCAQCGALLVVRGLAGTHLVAEGRRKLDGGQKEALCIECSKCHYSVPGIW